jgi:hypothetical protein
VQSAPARFACYDERVNFILLLFVLALQANSSRPVILAIGDSMTAGYGVAPELSYPAQLEKELKTRGFDYRVVNLGRDRQHNHAGHEPMTRALALQTRNRDHPARRQRCRARNPKERLTRKNVRLMIERF